MKFVMKNSTFEHKLPSPLPGSLWLVGHRRVVHKRFSVYEFGGSIRLASGESVKSTHRSGRATIHLGRYHFQVGLVYGGGEHASPV